MPEIRRKVARQRWRLHAASISMLACLTVFTGCKTSQDAAEAAKQMSATAKSLSDYYAALHTILTETEQIYALNEQLLAKPYTAETRQHLKNDEDALAKRAAFAKDFSTLADEFAKLTGSTAAADVSASADKLLTEADSLASVKASGAEQSLLKDALNLLVTSIKEHKEREAAKDIDTVAKILTDLFAKETDVWNSREAVHTQMAKNLAEYLADQDAVDNSAPLKVALDPFGLTPSVAHPDLSAKLAPLVKQQIATKAAACDDDYLKATDAMTKSLQEMSKRIRLVAEGKPMSFRLPPVTVDSVEQWATHLATY